MERVYRPVVVAVALGLFALAPAPVRAQSPCVVVDNGSGTVDLPPADCGYLGPDDVHMIIDGLPPDTTIVIGVEHQRFFDISTTPGGSLGGEVESFQSQLDMDMQGTGDLASFTRSLTIPMVQCQTHVGPRTPGTSPQDFDTVMQGLQGQLPPGDPDFDLLRVTAGTAFGMPSPGHTTLVDIGGGHWAVDSFFDITYRIDFVGASGGALAGQSGSTTGTIRMTAVGTDGGTTTTTTTTTLPPLDHFVTYQINDSDAGTPTPSFGPIVLADQFGSGRYNVTKVRALGVPADKNGEGIHDALTHLKEYQLRALDEPATPDAVRIVNQCNDTTIDIGKPVSILVPTNKDLVALPPPPNEADHDVDHFLCYAARGRIAKAKQVVAADQFETKRYDLRKITKLCVPAAKSTDSGDPPRILSGDNEGDSVTITPAAVRNPEAHLVCYQAKLAKALIPQAACACDTSADATCRGTKIDPRQPNHQRREGVFLNNQFFPEVVDTLKQRELCIPSQKILLP